MIMVTAANMRFKAEKRGSVSSVIIKGICEVPLFGVLESLLLKNIKVH